MANIISKELYQHLKAQPLEDLDATDREQINDYERAEVNAPSNADVNIATHIHNAVTSNPHTHGYSDDEIKWAEDIRAQESRYFHLKGGRAKDVYVQPVKRIPDDLIEGNDFKFNWKSVYENVKGEKLRDTEADYDKLKKFIDSNMYDVTDPVSLQKIAYDFHMYDPTKIPPELKTKEEIDAYFKNPWGYFINSEQGKEFKKYIADVSENQRKTAIKDIFDNESNFMVDFMLPVAKENAKQALLKGENPKLGVPLAFDAATNLAMLGGGKAGLLAAPTITNVGQVVSNDMDPAVAGVNTLLGTAINAYAPKVIDRGNRYLTMPGKKYSQRVEVKGRTDQLAKQAADTEKKIMDGAVFKLKSKFKTDSEGMPLPTEDLGYISQTKKILYSDNPEKAIKEYGLKGYTVRPLEEARRHDAGIIPENEISAYKTNNIIARNNLFEDTNILKPKEIPGRIKGAWNFSKKRADLRDKKYKMFNADHGAFKPHRDEAVKNVLEKLNKGEEISTFDLNELYALGYNPKESLISFLWRASPDMAKNYLTNFTSRKMSAGATMNIPNLFFGTNLNKFVEDKKKGKPKISEIFGGE